MKPNRQRPKLPRKIEAKRTYNLIYGVTINLIRYAFFFDSEFVESDSLFVKRSPSNREIFVNTV